MRDDIYTIRDGVKEIDYYKVIGTGYENGWFTNCPVRYRLFEGARNTKKSKDIIGYETIMKIVSDEFRNIMVTRKNDSDLRQSAYENICGCIYDLGWERSFAMRKNPLEIEYIPTGQKIIFRGLNSPTSLNSITFKHGFLTDVYIEEAFELESFADFRKLDGSLRGKLPDGYFLQITMCFNAWDGLTWLYHEFFKDRLEDDYEYYWAIAYDSSNGAKLEVQKGTFNQILSWPNVLADGAEVNYILEGQNVIYDIVEVTGKMNIELNGNKVLDYEISFQGICKKCLSDKGGI